MKKRIIYITIISIIIFTITIIFISSQNDDIEQPKFEYTISEITTSESDIALQNYTKSYYNENNKLDGEYASNIKNNQALADDPIVNFIPREYFTTPGTYNCFDINYGYYISTKQLDDDSYSSVVIMFDILFNYSYNTGEINLAVRPLFSNEYNTISKNKKFESIMAIGDDDYDNVIIPNLNSNCNYKIANLNIITELENVCYLNVGETNYNVDLDKGMFIIEASAATIINSSHYNDISKEYYAKNFDKPTLYLKKENKYLTSNDVIENQDEIEINKLNLYSIGKYQILEYGQLIKGVKNKFTNVTLDTNKSDCLPCLELTLEDRNKDFGVPTLFNINLSFNILDNDENYIDKINTYFSKGICYGGELLLENNLLITNNYESVMVNVETSGNYKIKAIKYNTDVLNNYEEIDITCRLHEIIDKQSSKTLEQTNNMFYLEHEKKYVFDAYYPVSAINSNDIYLILERVS